MINNQILLHSFTETIIEILQSHFGDDANVILSSSPLLQYINIKTKAANKGSKSRGSFANHYAIYVVIEDYINKGFYENDALNYSKYEGAKFSELLERQRKLPFGAKLQNHALNSRLNDEFKKFFPFLGKPIIVRDVESQRYWIQEDLLLVDLENKQINIAKAIIQIIEAYAIKKKTAFEDFINSCNKIALLNEVNSIDAIEFIISQLQPDVDARIFEIVSYAILKAKYSKESVWIGKTKDLVSEEKLILYKTGRTNANDGGIDFVMKPLGRFFQVTETIDVKKYFLDIDKIQKFPITFVVKTTQGTEEIIKIIEAQAIDRYKVLNVINNYMKAIEAIINTPILIEHLYEMIELGLLKEIMEEIIRQSKVEFNYTEEE